MDFAELVRSRSGRLVRLAYLLCGDRHRPEDLAQDTLLRAHPHWHRVQSPMAPYRSSSPPSHRPQRVTFRRNSPGVSV